MKFTSTFIIAGIAAGLLATILAQPSLSGKVSGGFTAPTRTDSGGRRHLVRGNSAESRGGGVLELTDPRVTRYNPDNTADMFIESGQCTYNTKAGLAFSSTNLVVRTADGRFSIEGIGWRWDLADSLLTISNQVSAKVQKAALDGSAGSTNKSVRITSARFQQEGDAATFLDEVLVRDGDDVLRCDQLRIHFAKPGGAQKIEAITGVDLQQRDTRIQAGRAVYDVKANTIQISENPKWRSGLREGSAGQLLIDREAETLAAEGQVYMKLPLTNLVLSTELTQTNSAPTNRYIEIRSDRFEYADAQSNRVAEAVYLGHVQATQAEALLSCEKLTATFAASNRLSRLRAAENVEIRAAKNKVFGREANYDFDAETVTVTGEPRWEIDQMKGRSDQLVFFPKTNAVLALHNVEMTVPGRSLGTLFSVGASSDEVAMTNTPLKITSQSLAHSQRLSVFENDVVVQDARGAIECRRLTLVSSQTNQMQRIVAEDRVVIKQPDLMAFGNKAEYDGSTGLIQLTGDPELLAPGKSLRAESFIIDRNRNTFSVSPGKYRIQLQLSKRQK